MREPCDKYPEIVGFMGRIDERTEILMGNHIPHLHAEIKSTKGMIKWVLAPLVGLVNGLLIAVILKLFNVF